MLILLNSNYDWYDWFDIYKPYTSLVSLLDIQVLNDHCFLAFTYCFFIAVNYYGSATNNTLTNHFTIIMFTFHNPSKSIYINRFIVSNTPDMNIQPLVSIRVFTYQDVACYLIMFNHLIIN